MDYELEHSRVEQKNRELHKLGAEVEEEKILPLQKEEFDVASDFKGAKIEKPNLDKDESFMKKTIRKSMKLLQWFAVIAISSTLAAIGYFVYQFLDPSARASEQNIVFTIDTPSGVNPGETAAIKLRVENKNNVALDGAEILLTLPVGTYENKAGNIQMVKETRSTIGIINAGETAEYIYKAYILGGEQELKNIKGQLTYKFINMDSVFTKNATTDIRILASPITVVVDTLKRATAGREVKTTINVRSNTEVPLKDVLVSVDYPTGFVYKSAEPRPVIGNGLWVIPKLERSNSASFEIDGMFSSEGASERVIRTRVGISDITTPNEIASLYQEILTPIALEAPFVEIKTLYNNKSPSNVVASYGVRMTGEVRIKNNSKSKINHAVVEVSISGTGLDEKSIDASKDGIYREESKTIYWDERNEDDLVSLDPGQTVSFTFSFVPDAGRNNGQYVANPEISTNVLVRAERENEQGVVGEVRTLSASTVRVATQSEFISRAMFFSGPIKNVGEIPPKVDKDTQFTIIWNIRNTSNSLEGGEVRASLPPAVSWAGVVVPSKEVVRYDENLHEVIWSVGSIPAGTGVGSVSPKEVAFQVVLTPSINDVDKYPFLIENQIFRARDSFTKKNIEIKQNNINTTLSSDAKADRNTGKVVGK